MGVHQAEIQLFSTIAHHLIREMSMEGDRLLFKSKQRIIYDFFDKVPHLNLNMNLFLFHIEYIISHHLPADPEYRHCR